MTQATLYSGENGTVTVMPSPTAKEKLDKLIEKVILDELVKEDTDKQKVTYLLELRRELLNSEI